MTEPTKIPKHVLISHDAMKTSFTLRLCGDDEAKLRGLGAECIAMIDELERKLSRYAEGGDVQRINHLKAGESLNISEECYACLREAMEMCLITGRLFDPTLGAPIEHRKTDAPGERPEVSGQLIVHPDSACVSCVDEGRVIDLGGIGKGFTLDRLAKFLQDWGLVGGLLSSGASTHVAFGDTTWPMDLTGDHGVKKIILHDAALSASGTSIQGAHIIPPDGWEVDEATMPRRLWVVSPDGSAADAWSTALMLMTPDEMARCRKLGKRLTAIYVENDTEIIDLAPL